MYPMSMQAVGRLAAVVMIVTSWLFCFSAYISNVHAASQGPLYAGTAANFNDGGTTPWSNPANAQGNNTATAATSTPPASGSTTQRLRATNFGFSIPEGSVITGVLTEVEYSANSNNRFRDISNKLLVGGVEAGDEHSIGANWTTTKTFAMLGGENDTWGINLTPEIVNSANFGLSIKGERYHQQTVTGSVFRVRMTVYFIEAENLSPTVMLISPENLESDLSFQPTLEFLGSDPEGDDLIFQVEISKISDGVVILATSASDAGFLNLNNGADTSPFASGDTISYAVQASDALSIGSYSWRVRALDPQGSNEWGEWSDLREFTVGVPLVSISITTDGIVQYGTLSAGQSIDTLDLDDTQTVQNDGNVAIDINIRSDAPEGWTLGATPGLNIFVHEYSITGGLSWLVFPLDDSYQRIAQNVSPESALDFDLRLTAPEPSTTSAEKTITITLQAVQH